MASTFEDVSEHQGPRYLTCAETAKLLRAELRREFPGAKFSVRSKTYSGGASISVSWEDGPAMDLVEPILHGYEGAAFDGMIDLATSRTHFLAPDGTVSLAHARGTESSRGTIPESFGDPHSPDAVHVHFMADYVFGYRVLNGKATAWSEDALPVVGYGDMPEWQQKQDIDRRRHALQRRTSFTATGELAWVHVTDREHFYMPDDSYWQ